MRENDKDKMDIVYCPECGEPVYRPEGHKLPTCLNRDNHTSGRWLVFYPEDDEESQH